MIRTALVLFFASNLWSNAVNAQIGSRYNVEDFAATITVQDLQMYLSVLASDALEGRETGTLGNDEAARFIAAQLSGFGIPPLTPEGSYFQDVTFTRTEWKDISLKIGDTTYLHMKDFICMKSMRNEHPVTIGEEMVFLGYGIDDPAYSDYTVNVKGKAILIYDGEPVSKRGKYRLTSSKIPSEWSGNWLKKIRIAREKGATAVFVISSDFQRLAGQIRRFSIGPSITLGDPDTATWPAVAIVSSDVARHIIQTKYDQVISARDRINKGKKANPVPLYAPFTLIAELNEKVTTGYNVLGYIEGSDPLLRDELIVMSAHFDHLGKRGDDIYNGADDNGSGTSTLLDVTQAFMLAKNKGMGPRRSVLALFVTGEEKGLLGSKFYVENPVFPLDQTVANVNMDMVGRVDKKYGNDPDYIYVIGSDKLSQDLHEINESINARYTKLKLDYTYNDEKDPNRYYYRSDHYNFVEQGIPAIFYFSGTHEDYHRPSDTIDKINFERMAKVGRLIFHTTWELANRDARIRLNAVKG